MFDNRGAFSLSAIMVLLFLAVAVLTAGCIDELFEDSNAGTSSSYTSGSAYSAASDYALLDILVYPAGSSVYIDGEYLGETTGQGSVLVEVAGGSHKIEVFKTGYEPYLEYVYASAGKTEMLTVYLWESPPTETVPPEPEPAWTWEPEPTYPGPVYVAQTRPVY